ncbi:MAG: CBS domain-containing protein [Planctomycetes bacterium]|nr:CBS domain-containing protein [Planctomycetota bacterium]
MPPGSSPEGGSKPGPESKGAWALAGSVAILAAGVLLLFVLQKRLGLAGEASFVALLVLPLVVYLALSGRLAEFKAGPIEAKLRQLAGESVGASLDFLPVSEEVGAIVQEIEVVAKGGLSQLPQVLEVLDRERAPVLYLTLGQLYVPGALVRYLDTLGQLRRFKFVVVTKPSGEVVCYMPQYTLRHLLTLPVRSQTLLAFIQSGREEELRRYPGMRATYLSPASTTKEALKKMTDQGLESLLVLDERGRLAGIVERDQVVGKLLLGLAS